MARTDGPDGTVSRRGLIKGAAAMGALGLMGSGLLSGCSPQAQSDKAAQTGSGIPDSWDEETDVVVVGAGGAGSMAALEVDKAGSSVILLEANSVAGGATSICGQAICAAGTKLQATLGVDDDADAFYAYLCEAGDGIVDFWRLYADNAAEIVDWLASIGVSFPEQLEVTPGLSLGGQEFLAPNQPVVPRVHWSDTEAGGIWTHLWKQVEASGVDVRMKTQATKLIFDPDTREVFGVVAGGKTIKARKGVVLAGGGIGANRELMRMYIQENKVLSQGTQFADGMTLNMAIDAGAASYGWEMAYAPGYLMGDYEEGRGQTAHAFVQMMHNSAPHPDVPYVLVDIYGKRRINETGIIGVGEQLGLAPEGKMFHITDEVGGGDLGWGMPGEVAYEQADTLEELAEKLGIDPEGLVATVNAWNEGAARGEDPEFGRTNVFAFEGGPYVGLGMYQTVTDTMGGAHVDTGMHVLKALDSQPIPRLYRGGPVGFRGYPLCGAAVGMALLSGKIAGQNVVNEEPWS
ncbi:FAD-dependent oxidoreductase [Rubneribacter sp.]|nr:FAD-dependent oxidoreductase [Candidatus Rubneribacter avistercoris]